MKKLILGVLMLALLAAPVMSADSATAALTLSGTVAKKFTVTPSVTSYAFVNAGTTDTLLANLQIVSNYKAGFSIAFTSNTGAFDIRDAANSITLWGYSLKLEATSVVYNTAIPFNKEEMTKATRLGSR